MSKNVRPGPVAAGLILLACGSPQGVTPVPPPPPPPAGAQTADVSATVQAPTRIGLGMTVLLRVEVRNDGPDAARDVRVEADLSGAAHLVDASPAAEMAGGRVAWAPLASLANGSTTVVTATLEPDGTGDLGFTVRAQGSTDDPNPSNNDGTAVAMQAVTSVVEHADVALAVAGPERVGVGDTVSYAVTIRNDGTQDATAIGVRAQLPVDAVVVAADGGAAIERSAITWPTIASLSPAAERELGFTVHFPVRYTTIVPVEATSTSLDLRPENNDGSIGGGGLSVTISGCPGAYPAQASSEYILPFPVGRTYPILQGNCNDTNSHRSSDQFKYAYDITMAIGDTILAARGGTVNFVKDDGPNGTLLNADANYLVVVHADGTRAVYGHLTTNGALVSVGDAVAQGQPIALSGNSGVTANFPHLHFEVKPCSGCVSLPVTFRNARDHVHGGLLQGDSYTALAGS